MSELKTYKMVDEKYCTDCVCVIPSEVYLKSEADKYIKELVEKLNYSRDARKYWRNEFSIEHKELRHNKYKRCLAMVKYCDMGLTYYNEKLDSFSCEYADFFYRWYNRWYKLAEKFKDKEA